MSIFFLLCSFGVGFVSHFLKKRRSAKKSPFGRMPRKFISKWEEDERQWFLLFASTRLNWLPGKKSPNIFQTRFIDFIFGFSSGSLSLSHCVCVFGQYKKYLFRIRMGRIYQARINVNGTILNVWIACAVMSSEHSLDSGWLEWTGTTPFTVILSRMLVNANECKKTCCKYFIAADRN